MCMACEEMQLYYAYLDAVEEAKRKAQPWQCEVTLIAQDDKATAPVTAVAAKPPKSKFSKLKSSKSNSAKSTAAKPGFACDNPE
jgi:hypothetical protein